MGDGRFVCKCECGGDVLGAAQFGQPSAAELARVPTTAPPNCPTCGKRLRAYAYFGHSVIDPLGTARWGYQGNNIFCSLRCGFNWALVKMRRVDSRRQSDS